jgi:hypothetical protein
VRRRRRTLGLSGRASRPYSPAEDEALRALLAEGGDVDALARRLGRSPDALRLHARALGLTDPRPRRRWVEREDVLLRKGYALGLTCPAISARFLPGRSSGAVAARARKLGLASYARLWSAAEERRLAELARLGTPLEEAAALLVRTPEAVRRQARRLGLPALPSSQQASAHRRWRREDDDLLRGHASLDPGALAQMLGRSDQAVRRRLVALGLRRGRERSPHHPLPPSAEPSPGELRLLARELEEESAGRLLSLSRRLGRSPGALKRIAATLEDDRAGGRGPGGKSVHLEPSRGRGTRSSSHDRGGLAHLGAGSTSPSASAGGSS